MSNMYQIIKLCSASDDRCIAYAPVNCTIGAYFNEVVDQNLSTTLHFFIPGLAVLFCIKIKSIAAYNSAGMYFNIVSNNAIIINNYTGMKDAMITNNHIIS